MPELSLIVLLLAAWVLLAVLTALVFVVFPAWRRSRRGGSPGEDRRAAGEDRRTAGRDRRLGLPDTRAVRTERRSGVPDRRLGPRDRRGPGRNGLGARPTAQM